MRASTKRTRHLAGITLLIVGLFAWLTLPETLLNRATSAHSAGPLVSREGHIAFSIGPAAAGSASEVALGPKSRRSVFRGGGRPAAQV